MSTLCSVCHTGNVCFFCLSVAFFSPDTIHPSQLAGHSEPVRSHSESCVFAVWLSFSYPDSRALCEMDEQGEKWQCCVLLLSEPCA